MGIDSRPTDASLSRSRLGGPAHQGLMLSAKAIVGLRTNQSHEACGGDAGNGRHKHQRRCMAQLLHGVEQPRINSALGRRREPQHNLRNQTEEWHNKPLLKPVDKFFHQFYHAAVTTTVSRS